MITRFTLLFYWRCNPWCCWQKNLRFPILDESRKKNFRFSSFNVCCLGVISLPLLWCFEFDQNRREIRYGPATPIKLFNNWIRGPECFYTHHFGVSCVLYTMMAWPTFNHIFDLIPFDSWLSMCTATTQQMRSNADHPQFTDVKPPTQLFTFAVFGLLHTWNSNSKNQERNKHTHTHDTQPPIGSPLVHFNRNGADTKKLWLLLIWPNGK